MHKTFSEKKTIDDKNDKQNNSGVDSRVAISVIVSALS